MPTVCVAVICESGSKIILVSDRLLSFTTTSTEIALKTKRLHRDWCAMFAAEDVGPVDLVLGQIISDLVSKEGVSALEAVHATRRAYKSVRKMQIEDSYLSTFDWSIEQFLAEGKAKFPSDSYSTTFNDIQKFDLRCMFLIAGFSRGSASNPSKPIGTLFYIGNPGVISPCTVLGWSVIGSGEANASTYLARRGQTSSLSLSRSLYFAVAAKRLAESADGVGEQTNVLIMKPDEGHEWLSPNKINAISKMWEDEESKVVPAHLDERVSEILEP